MKKYLLLSAIILGIITVANAQTKKFKFSAGGGIASYTAGTGGKSTMGFGIDIIGKTDISENFEGYIQAGYNTFSSDGGSWGIIPVLVGANFKAGNFKPGLGIGYGNLTAGSGGVGGFAISPQIGYGFEKIDLVASYTNISVSDNYSLKVFGLKLFYNF
jgi:hypothetical protein